MKIVVLPGVGFHDKVDPKDIPLINCLMKRFPQDTIEYFNWNNGHTIPPPPEDMTWWFKPIRKFLIEVIFDFDQVIAHPFETYVPPADIYIGHSAGSVLAMLQGKPTVTFGSPYEFVADLQSLKSLNTKTINRVITERAQPVFNIVNDNDILAANIKVAENYHYKAGWTPWTAHWDYWDNKDVCKHIAAKIEEWKNL